MTVSQAVTEDFSVNELPRKQRFQTWRKNLADAYEVKSFGEITEKNFIGTIQTLLMNRVVIASTESRPQQYLRTAETIASSNFDHLLMEIVWSGSRRIDSPEQSLELSAGDIILFDPSQPVTQSIYGDDVDERGHIYRDSSVIVPKDLLADASLDLRELHFCVLPAGQVESELLKSTVKTYIAQSANVSLPLRAAYENAFVGLLVACLNSEVVKSQNICTTRVADRAENIRASLAAAIDKYIDEPGLDVDLIAKTLHVSRSTLYRHCKSMGGVAAVIRNRRLLRAHQHLRAANNGSLSITQLASELGFSSVNVFSRAYKTHFGITPKQTLQMDFQGSDLNIESNISESYIKGLFKYF